MNALFAGMVNPLILNKQVCYTALLLAESNMEILLWRSSGRKGLGTNSINPFDNRSARILS